MGGNLIRHAGPQADEAADVVALDLFTLGAADDNVGNLFGVQLRELVQYLAQNLAAKVHGMGVFERSLLSATHSAAAKCGDDDILRLKIAHN